MQSMLTIGIIIFTGFVLGELVAKIKLPKVTGYILAGILLNPGLFGFIPRDFVDQTSVATSIPISSTIGFIILGSQSHPRVIFMAKVT